VWPPSPSSTHSRGPGMTRWARQRSPIPYTLGIEAAGTVAAVGDRVYLTGSRGGTYAELTVCAAEQAHPLPATVSFAQGAAVDGSYAADAALFLRAKAQPGETVLVHGASGGVEIASVQLRTDGHRDRRRRAGAAAHRRPGRAARRRPRCP